MPHKLIIHFPLLVIPRAGSAFGATPLYIPNFRIRSTARGFFIDAFSITPTRVLFDAYSAWDSVFAAGRGDGDGVGEATAWVSTIEEVTCRSGNNFFFASFVEDDIVEFLCTV